MEGYICPVITKNIHILFSRMLATTLARYRSKTIIYNGYMNPKPILAKNK